MKKTKTAILLLVLAGSWGCNIEDNVEPLWEQLGDASDEGSVDSGSLDLDSADSGHGPADAAGPDALDAGSDDTEDADAHVADAVENDVSPDADPDVDGDVSPDADPDVDGDVSCDYVPDPASTQGLNDDQAMLLNLHNEYRQRVGSQALRWNADLAQQAQDWANACELRTDPDRSSKSAEFTQVGESVAFGGGAPITLEMLTTIWTDQAAVYGYARPLTVDQLNATGSYTQMVWSTTTDVGCGWFEQCEGIYNFALVCRYGPAGNIIDRSPYPFATGPCLDLDNDGVLQKDDPDDTDPSVP